MEFKATLEKIKAEVNEEIKTALDKAAPFYEKNLFQSMSYSLENGGKRLRPIMLLTGYRAFGGDETEIGPVKSFALALECIHSYSLVHDDLPEMDNDMYRRGKLTTHAKFGQAAAVLAGDGLLNYAFELCAKTIRGIAERGNAEKILRAAKAFDILSEKAGAGGMIGGQSLDVLLTGKDLNDDDLNYINKNKTSALICAALMCGAALSGLDDDGLATLEKVGEYVGEAFQIRDDYLDVTSTEEVLGKPINSDADNKKTTYVTLHGLSEAQQKVVEDMAAAESMLIKLLGQKGGKSETAAENAEFLMELLKSLVEREK